MRAVSVLALVSCLGALPGARVSAQSVTRFDIAPSSIGLLGDVRSRQYLGVLGRKAAWLGAETDEAELWVHPLKLANGFRLDLKIPEYDTLVRGAEVAPHAPPGPGGRR